MEAKDEILTFQRMYNLINEKADKPLTKKNEIPPEILRK
jgi:hypothetical protein